jgi:hypothetical protein
MNPVLMAAFLALELPSLIPQIPREFTVFHRSPCNNPNALKAVSVIPSTVKVTSGIWVLCGFLGAPRSLDD